MLQIKGAQWCIYLTCISSKEQVNFWNLPTITIGLNMQKRKLKVQLIKFFKGLSLSLSLWGTYVSAICLNLREREKTT